ncbi:uncharacterized protein [Palaemon carinicauda]|uniref:uncharacterized protein n=1 Tax=Palaemon carinicauda TaxID=392227 RepID=UPI0035B5F7DF
MATDDSAGRPTGFPNTRSLAHKDGPLTEVRALVGGSALLPCHMDPPIEKDSTHLVLFYYSHQGTPIYSLDSRGSVLDNAKHRPDERLLNRAYIKTDQGQRGLVLEKVTQEDEGDYRCRVDYLGSPTKYFRIKLIVVTPPDKVEITSNFDGKRSLIGTAGPYALGTRVVFYMQSDWRISQA